MFVLTQMFAFLRETLSSQNISSFWANAKEKKQCKGVVTFKIFPGVMQSFKQEHMWPGISPGPKDFPMQIMQVQAALFQSDCCVSYTNHYNIKMTFFASTLNYLPKDFDTQGLYYFSKWCFPRPSNITTSRRQCANGREEKSNEWEKHGIYSKRGRTRKQWQGSSWHPNPALPQGDDLWP